MTTNFAGNTLRCTATLYIYYHELPETKYYFLYDHPNCYLRSAVLHVVFSKEIKAHCYYCGKYQKQKNEKSAHTVATVQSATIFLGFCLLVLCGLHWLWINCFTIGKSHFYQFNLKNCRKIVGMSIKNYFSRFNFKVKVSKLFSSKQ